MNPRLSLVAALLIFAVTFFQAEAQVSGSGTKGKIPVWTGSTSLGNSNITQASGGIKVTGTATAITGTSSSKVTGVSAVLGQSTAKTGVVNGVVGISVSNTDGATGVVGMATGATGTVFGVRGETNSPAGVGVIGLASGSDTATGVVAGTSGSTGNAVQAINSATTGTGGGIYAQTGSPGGSGVVGNNVATSGVALGVLGATASPGGAGGVFQNFSGGTSLILVGNGSNSQVFNVDASGNAFFKGNVSKGGGSFKIDHPLDPANKYLSHSFVESPDMVNLYNGNVTTDQHGVSVVVLPDYFEALNRDFRYQLTVIGQFAQAIVAQEIEKGRFTIKTDKPSVKVSWQVTGVRQDAFANAHRIQVEEEKPAQERGHYLHPELFGATEKEAVGSTSHPEVTLPVTEAMTNRAGLR